MKGCFCLLVHKANAAHQHASRAITFAFPHCCNELLKYGDYIEAEFAAKLTLSHHCIILYNTVLRNEVGGGQHCLLTDSHASSSIKMLPDRTIHESRWSNLVSRKWCVPINNSSHQSMVFWCIPNLYPKKSHACSGTIVFPMYSLVWLSSWFCWLPSSRLSSFISESLLFFC